MSNGLPISARGCDGLVSGLDGATIRGIDEGCRRRPSTFYRPRHEELSNQQGMYYQFSSPRTESRGGSFSKNKFCRCFLILKTSDVFYAFNDQFENLGPRPPISFWGFCLLKSPPPQKKKKKSGKFPKSLKGLWTVWKNFNKSGKFPDSFESFRTVWKIFGQSEIFWKV